jgi:hypothetical protein
MNSEPRLESLIDRELKSLPPLAAPDTLAPRVMAALAARAALPWYRRAWQTWPRAGQILSLAALAAVFAGLAVAGGHLFPAGTARPTGGLFATVSLVASLLATVGEALLLAAKQLHPAWVATGLLVLSAGWLSCLGLGTAIFRLALARR